MRKTHLYAVAILVVATLTGSTIAEKPASSGKTKVNRITEFEAADVTFADNTTDVIQSDGRGTYQSFAEGFEAYSEYGFTELISGDRGFGLNLGKNLSGDASIDPSGPIIDVLLMHRVENFTFDDLEASFPEPGTTISSTPSNPQSVRFTFMAADGNKYGLYVSDDSGAISLSGYDLDGDGKNDARSIQVSQSAVWELYVQTTYTVVVGRGKNQTTEERETYVMVAEYTEMSLDMWLDLLGFRVKQFAVR